MRCGCGACLLLLLPLRSRLVLVSSVLDTLIPTPLPPPLSLLNPLAPPPASLTDENEMMRGGGGGGYEYQQQQYYGPRGAPHGLLMAVVLGLAVAGPLFLGDGAITEAVADLLGPTGMLLLPVGLILVIRVLSSDRGAAALADAFAFGSSPDSVHRVGGSPVGVALALALIVLLLYYRTSLFGGDAGDDE